MEPRPAAPTRVLLEGPSDVAALEAVLRRAPEVTGTAYLLVDLGGVTNTAAHLRQVWAQPVGERPRVLGLCDAAEAWIVARALQGVGVDVAGVEELGAHGFFVCERDLEEELIRALGVEGVLAVLEAEGMARGFAGFSAQLHWQGRPVEERLRRFCGVAAGRKVRLAGAMAAALPADRLPAPIAGLVGALAGQGRIGA